MSIINISKVLGMMRREKGVTQDQLASYLGVTKASVSKWETGQSYPDILFLPQLAAYFNISVDELIGYEPQMTEAGIRATYLRLSERFAADPFEEVLQEWEEIVKKYHACFPLLFNMGMLMVNHINLAKDEEQRQELLRQIRKLMVRIKEESRDIQLCREANSFEAICEVNLNNPTKAVELLENANEPPIGEEVILASAYQILGNQDKAKETIQVGVVRHLIGVLSDMPNFLMLHMDQPDTFDEAVKRMLKLIDAFQIEALHPGILAGLYGSMIYGYAMIGRNEQGLDILERYVELFSTVDYPLTLHGDAFFDRLDNWYEGFTLGNSLPKTNVTGMKDGVVAMVKEASLAEMYKDDQRYHILIRRLEHRLLE